MEASKAYVAGKPFLSDEQFDDLKQQLRTKNSKVVSQVLVPDPPFGSLPQKSHDHLHNYTMQEQAHVKPIQQSCCGRTSLWLLMARVLAHQDRHERDLICSTACA